MASEIEQLPAAVRWECGEKRRYYLACVQRNLFGELEVWRAWGGIGSSRGGEQCDPVKDLDEVRDKLAMIDRRRRARGYLGQPGLSDRATAQKSGFAEG